LARHLNSTLECVASYRKDVALAALHLEARAAEVDGADERGLEPADDDLVGPGSEEPRHALKRIEDDEGDQVPKAGLLGAAPRPSVARSRRPSDGRSRGREESCVALLSTTNT